MGLRSPRVAVPLAFGAGLLFWVGFARGTAAVQNVLGGILLAGGLMGPCVAAFRLGKEALATPPLRPRLVVVLALASIAAILLGWWGLATTGHLIALALVVMGVAACSVGAVMSTAGPRSDGPLRPAFEKVARSLWTLALAGGVLYLSFPLGWGFQERAVRRAKGWVETAVREVRAEEKATGRPPGSLLGILQRLEPPPRLVPRDGGYSTEAITRGPSAGTTTFEFRIDDPSGFLAGWWVYDGKTGAWSRDQF